MRRKNTTFKRTSQAFLSFVTKFYKLSKSNSRYVLQPRPISKKAPARFHRIILKPTFAFMTPWKRLFRFYIDSSIHVALAICALAAVTILTYDLAWHWSVFAFLFSASITGYNFAKYAGQARFHHRSLTNQLKSIQIFSLLAFVVLIYTAILQSLPFLLTNLVLGLLTLFYAVPVLPNQKNLRSLTSLKVFIIAFVWAGAALWLPLVDQQSLFKVDVFWKTLIYFVFVLALILPFEIRDLHFDEPNLGTIPQRIGIRKTKIFGYSLLLIFIILHLLEPLATLQVILTSLGIAGLTGVLIYFSSTDQSPNYASFWVESLPILWFVSLALLKL